MQERLIYHKQNYKNMYSKDLERVLPWCLIVKRKVSHKAFSLKIQFILTSIKIFKIIIWMLFKESGFILLYHVESHICSILLDCQKDYFGHRWCSNDSIIILNWIDVIITSGNQERLKILTESIHNEYSKSLLLF